PWGGAPSVEHHVSLHQPEGDVAMGDGYGRPDERRGDVFVPDERRHADVPVHYRAHDVRGDQPRVRLEPDPLVPALGDLPPDQVTRRGWRPAQTEAQQHPLDERDADAYENRTAFEHFAKSLLERGTGRPTRRRAEHVGVVG